MDDLTAVLGPNIGVSRGELSRPSLLLQTMAMPSQSERLAWLAERLEDIAGSGIIYALTVRDAVQGHQVVAVSWLERGVLYRPVRQSGRAGAGVT